MSKGIELTPSQIKAYENGATMFLFPCKTVKIPMTRKGKNVGFTTQQNINLDSFKIKKGDKDIFIQEDFIDGGEVVGDTDDCGYMECWLEQTGIAKERNKIAYVSDFEEMKKENISINLEDIEISKASKMTKDQARHFFDECIDIRIVNVQGRNEREIIKMIGNYANRHIFIYNDFKEFYNRQMQEQNISRTYEDNDYVFLVEFKK